MNVFISMPLNGKTFEEIANLRKIREASLNNFLGSNTGIPQV